MYKLSHFTEQDRDTIISFLQSHPFVTLIGCDAASPVVTQIPVLIDITSDEVTIRGHFMRNTDHHKVFEKNQDALVLFQGAHCYVSASWYNERGHGSTWNYMTVHARGRMEFYSDEQTIGLLTDLTHHYEDVQKYPELLENMSTDYVRNNVKAIQGFEMKIAKLDAVFKLSQNRNDESYIKIVKELEAADRCDEKSIAWEMKKRRENLF